MAEMDFNDPHAAPLRAKLRSVASSLKFLAEHPLMMIPEWEWHSLTQSMRLAAVVFGREEGHQCVELRHTAQVCTILLALALASLAVTMSSAREWIAAYHTGPSDG
eukprot:SAG31_NODE_4619_length_3091_cov_2.016711_3_plen_106_part_00